MGLHLTVITNGTKVTPQLVEQLGRLPLAISESLDTLNRETHQRIHGADQLEQVLEGLGLLRGSPIRSF